MKYVSFTLEEKAKLFDEISACITKSSDKKIILWRYKGTQLFVAVGCFCFTHHYGRRTMPMAREKKLETLEELTAEMKRSEKQLHYWEDQEKILRHIQTLKAAHIDEDNYFAHMVHDDMDAIAKDIRSAHTKDFDTAPETSVADTIREGIEEAANFKGSAKETQLFLLCHQLGLDYKSLSPEEFTVLMKALNRSKKLKSATNQRGRKGKRR